MIGGRAVGEFDGGAGEHSAIKDADIGVVGADGDEMRTQRIHSQTFDFGVEAEMMIEIDENVFWVGGLSQIWSAQVEFHHESVFGSGPESKRQPGRGGETLHPPGMAGKHLGRMT